MLINILNKFFPYKTYDDKSEIDQIISLTVVDNARWHIEQRGNEFRTPRDQWIFRRPNIKNNVTEYVIPGEFSVSKNAKHYKLVVFKSSNLVGHTNALTQIDIMKIYNAAHETFEKTRLFKEACIKQNSYDLFGTTRAAQH